MGGMKKIGLVIACSPGRGSAVQLKMPSGTIPVPVWGGAALVSPPSGFQGFRDDLGSQDDARWSMLNPFLNECTAYRWAARNLDRIGLSDADYIGTAHYHRVIALDPSRLGTDVNAAGVDQRLRHSAYVPAIRHPLPALQPGPPNRQLFPRFHALERFVHQATMSDEERESMKAYFYRGNMGFMRNMFYMPKSVFEGEYAEFLERFGTEAMRIVGFDGRNPGYVMEQLASWWFAHRFPEARKCRYFDGPDGVVGPRECLRQ